MRLHCWWRQAAFSAAMLLGVSSGAYAQYATYDPSAPTPDGGVATSTETGTQAAADTSALIARITRLEGMVQTLGQQLDDERKAKAQNTSLASELAEQKDGGKAPAAAGGPKKVETIVKPTMTIEGRMFFDAIAYEDPPALVAATGVDRLNEFGFNTIRFGVKGTIYENVQYAAEVEFEGSETDFKDIYVETTNMPLLGTGRVGHFKEPFSLEEITSSRYITFMQRSSAHGAFVPSRNFGLMAYNYIAENENWSWYAGTFRHDSPDNPTARASHIADENDWVFTGRLAGLLFYDDPSQGRYLVHVGGAYSMRNDLTVVSFASRPELGSQAGYLSSTFTGDDDWNLWGGEAAIVWGPGSVQAEYYLAQPGDEEVNGGYIEASYFVTGENRAYRKDRKCFDRVKPIEDFFRVSTCEGVCMGRGAWQLKARYSWLDLNAGALGIRGLQDGFSAGANWYWNPYTRMMFDYVHEDVDLLAGLADSTDNVGVRFQIDY